MEHNTVMLHWGWAALRGRNNRNRWIQEDSTYPCNGETWGLGPVRVVRSGHVVDRNMKPQQAWAGLIHLTLRSCPGCEVHGTGMLQHQEQPLRPLPPPTGWLTPDMLAPGVIAGSHKAGAFILIELHRAPSSIHLPQLTQGRI